MRMDDKIIMCSVESRSPRNSQISQLRAIETQPAQPVQPEDSAGGDFPAAAASAPPRIRHDGPPVPRRKLALSNPR